MYNRDAVPPVTKIFRQPTTLPEILDGGLPMKNPDQRIRKSNNLRTLLVVALIFAVLFSLLGSILYISIKDTVAQRLGHTAQSTASAAAAAIMEDPQAYRAQMDLADAATTYYKEMQQYLESVLAGSNVRYLYTETKLDAETVTYVLGSAPADQTIYRAPGETAPNISIREKAYLTKQPVSSGLLEDDLGREIVLAYAPIFDTDGALLGLVGAEVGTQELYAALYNQFAIVLFICVLSFALVTTFFVKLAPHILAMVIRDEMTGAYNRRYITWFLKQWIKRVHKMGAKASVLLVDIDGLGTINDRFGREFGDLVLQYFAKRVTNTLRIGDRFARLEGGRFAVALPGTPPEMAARVANRVRRIAENNAIHNFSAQYSTKATVSIGVAGVEPEVASAGELLANASQALDAAKKQRNAVALYQQGEILLVQEQK